MSDRVDRKPKKQSQSERPDDGTIALADDGPILYVDVIDGKLVERWVHQVPIAAKSK